MIFCVRCGKSLDDQSKFCTGCGTLVSPLPQQIPAPPPRAVPVRRPPDPFPKRMPQGQPPQQAPPYIQQGANTPYTPQQHAYAQRVNTPQPYAPQTYAQAQEAASQRMGAQPLYPQGGAAAVSVKKKSRPAVIVAVAAGVLLVSVIAVLVFGRFFSGEKNVAVRVEGFFHSLYANDFNGVLEIIDPAVSAPLFSRGESFTLTLTEMNTRPFLRLISATGSYLEAGLQLGLQYELDSIENIIVDGDYAEALLTFRDTDQKAAVELELMRNQWYVMDIFIE